MKLTDWELIRMSPVPLLLIKNPHPYRRPVILAAIDPSRAHAKPQTLDRDILRTAQRWSSALHGTLHAVHAYDRFPLNMPPEALTPGLLGSLEKDAERVAGKRVARAVHPQRIARKRRHLIALPPVEAIEWAATQTRCAVVVMGAISRSAIKRMLIGNTAEHVLDVLACDVLILKPSEFEYRVPRKNRGAYHAAETALPRQRGG